MEVKKFYDLNISGDCLDSGRKLMIDHGITFRPERADLSPFVETSLEELKNLREKSAAVEQNIFERMKGLADKWEQAAAVTTLLDHAIEYLSVSEVEHTGNRWKQDKNNTKWMEISNRVYKMWYMIRVETEDNPQTKEDEPVAAYVTWNVSLNGRKREVKLAGQIEKRYPNKAAAMKYVEGRKKAYEHLFREISPPIPKEYAKEFECNGLLLPGYTVEGQEPRRAEHTAAEILESMAGGIFVESEKKASLLGKLSVVKDQKQMAVLTGTENKKKEAVSR